MWENNYRTCSEVNNRNRLLDLLAMYSCHFESREKVEENVWRSLEIKMLPEKHRFLTLPMFSFLPLSTYEISSKNNEHLIVIFFQEGGSIFEGKLSETIIIPIFANMTGLYSFAENADFRYRSLDTLLLQICLHHHRRKESPPTSPAAVFRLH